MESHTAICFGESLIDHHPGGSFVAGAPLHVAARLSALGWQTYLLSRVGNDEPGASILQAVESLGIGGELMHTDESLPTGSAVVNDGEDGMNRFDLAYPAAWDRISVPNQLPDHEVFYFGSLVGRREPGRQALITAASMSEARLKVCDINLRHPWVSEKTVGWALDNATVLKCSQEELERLSPHGARALLEDHPQLQLVAITAGELGASLHLPGQDLHQPAPVVDIVDTIGAGDAFTAGLIDGLVRDLNASDLLTEAIGCASRAVAARGGLPIPDNW